MAKNKLRDLMQEAQGYIKAGRYDEARVILERIDAKVDNATVKKWLVRLDEIAPRDDPFSDLEFPDAPQKKRGGKLWWVGVVIGACALLTLCSVIGQVVGIIPDATEIVQTSVVAAAATDTILSQTPPIATETTVPTETAIPSATMTLSPVPSDTLPSSATPLPSDTPTMTNTITPSDTPIPTVPTVTATLEFVSNEEVEIFEWLSQQVNVEAVISVLGDGGRFDDPNDVSVIVSIVVETGTIDVTLSEAFRMQIISIYDVTTKTLDISLYMDDGEQKVLFSYSQFSDGWEEIVTTDPFVPVRDGINAYSCWSTECSVIRTFNTSDVLPSTGNINGWEYIVIKGVQYYVQEGDVESF